MTATDQYLLAAMAVICIISYLLFDHSEPLLHRVGRCLLPIPVAAATVLVLCHFGWLG